MGRPVDLNRARHIDTWGGQALSAALYGMMTSETRAPLS